MNWFAGRDALDQAALGTEMHELVRELYPICRSITGRGVRETLIRVQERLPLEIREVPSGTQVLDWTVPQEWNVRQAYVADESGQRLIDFDDCNLHLVGYSIPVDAVVTRAELEEHLHSLPDRPESIPFRTSFYSPNWGFCVSQRQREALVGDRFRVVIDTTLEDGSLTYGECVLPGETDEEVLLTTHICHPSLANDNLSGIAVLAGVGGILASQPRRYTYRLLFNPVTIGSITWLAQHADDLGRIRHGLVVAGVGDPGGFTYKRSRRSDATVDRAAAHILALRGPEHTVEDFSPYGYDERQFCSPGFDLPVGSLSRTPHGRYPEYHTSDDTPDFVSPDRLAESLDVVLEILAALETDARYRNLAPHGEPQLGRRGLYKAMGGHSDASALQMAILWMLNMSDGQHSVVDIAERSHLPFGILVDAADALRQAGLLEPVEGGP